MTPRDLIAKRHNLTGDLVEELSICLDVTLAGDGATFYAKGPAADVLRERGFIVATSHEDADGCVGNVYRFTKAGTAAVRDLFGVSLDVIEPTPLPPNVVRLSDRRPRLTDRRRERKEGAP